MTAKCNNQKKMLPSAAALSSPLNTSPINKVKFQHVLAFIRREKTGSGLHGSNKSHANFKLLTNSYGELAIIYVKF